MALTLSTITCDYRSGVPASAPALDGVSFSVETGALALVLGPTGSGKTTLLRAAAGLVPLSDGSMSIDGAAPDKRGGAWSGIGLVFQRPEAQFFALSVEEDCAFGPRNLGLSATAACDAARDALASVGLDPDRFGEREPWTLSGGEARRAALAGVLAMRPRYLLLDEPTAGLDADAADAVLSAIDGIRDRTGVAIVTHDPERFIGRATSVLVMRSGREVFSGDISRFLDELPKLAGEGIAEAPGVSAVLLRARARGVLPPGPLTLDPVAGARMLLPFLSAGGDAR